MVANKIRVLEQWTVRNVADTSVADLGSCVCYFVIYYSLPFLLQKGVYYFINLIEDATNEII